MSQVVAEGRGPTRAAGLDGTGVALRRPRLRGWIHAAAAPIALLGVWVLRGATPPDSTARLSALVFGSALVGLYATSSVYHVPEWREAVRRVLSRVDCAMIQIFIAASLTPFAVHALHGPWRTGSLVVAWTVAIIGAAIALSPLTGPRWLIAGAYLAVGWLGAVPLVRIAANLPWEGTVLLAVGGLLYTAGGVVYGLQRPNPWPRWFGFHEVFHVLVVLAGALHFVAVWRFALPLA